MSSTCPSVCACVRAYMRACFYSTRRHSPTGLPSASYVQFIFSLVTSSTCKPVIGRASGTSRAYFQTGPPQAELGRLKSDVFHLSCFVLWIVRTQHREQLAITPAEEAICILHKNLRKIRLVVPEICSRTDRQTYTLQYSALIQGAE